MTVNKPFVNRYNNPLAIKPESANTEECTHKITIEDKRLICEYCGENFKF